MLPLPLHFDPVDGSTLKVRLEAKPGPDSEGGLEPLSCCVPWPEGLLPREPTLALVDAGGRSLLCQSSVIDRWHDGSPRWVRVDWIADLPAGGTWFEVSHQQSATRTQEWGFSTEIDGGLRVEARDTRLEVGSRSHGVTIRAVAEGAAGPRWSLEFVVITAEGEELIVESAVVEVEARGPVAARVRAEGTLVGRSRGKPGLRFRCRYGFIPTLGLLEVDWSLHNPGRAMHRGGQWPLGDPGSMLLESATVRLRGSGRGAPVRCSVESDRAFEDFERPFQLRQESSGGENWSSRNHVNRFGEVPLSFRGYRGRGGDRTLSGLRASPIVGVEAEGGGLWLAPHRFWQEFPKEIVASGDGLEYQIFPPGVAGQHEIQGGERKTHSFVIGVSRGGETLPLAWTRSPASIAIDPSWLESTGALPASVPSLERDAGIQALLADAVEGPNSFYAKRERADEYGWRNFGDLHADHEEAYYDGPKPIVSHYNNQYDAVLGLATQFLRTGDPRWWALCDDLARHVSDIDVYRTHLDKAAYNRGLFWHTDHYADAETSTHRSYPSGRGKPGGGPSNEHNYSSGLLLHHLLTASPESRETVLGLATWVVDMDDGRKSRFRFLDRGRSGLASCTAAVDYHGPGRGCGNSIQALLDAFHLTADRSYLDKAEELIRRSIHPRDDIESRELENVELRWSYLVFLQALGRYLEEKKALGELDRMYSYARDSLLHYAEWMLEHEYHYLDQPELLEYPTETWVAHELRKSDVFCLAAMASTGQQRGRFLEKAESFHSYALAQLGSMPTRTTTRPQVILLSNGHRLAEYRLRPQALPVPAESWESLGGPWPFEAQKARVKRRVKRLAVASSLLLALSLVLLALSVL